MSIFPLNSELVDSSCSYVQHMRRFQLFSCIPLTLRSPNFSRISKPCLLMSLVLFVLNLTHKWAPQLSLQFHSSGPFSAVLMLVQKTIHSAVPALFVATSLKNRFEFEKSTNKFLLVLKTLGLWRYRMFLSIVMSLFFVGVANSIFRIAILVSMQRDIIAAIDETLWVMYYFYLFSWWFMFMYTVRAVQNCFQKLTEMTIDNDANLKSYFQTYNRLIDIASETNDFYDIPVSINLLLSLLMFLDQTSLAMSAIETMTMGEIVQMYAWIAVFLGLLIAVLGTCHSASEQADSSNGALFRHLVQPRNAVTQDNPLLMIHLCARKRLVFKACKSFTINYNLGLSMMAAYVTYFIVLFQVEHTPRSPPINFTFQNAPQQHSEKQE